MVERVALWVVRAFAKVDAPHVFAPADDLADEPFDRVQRRVAFFVSVFGSPTDLNWVEQTHVEIRRDQRVIEEAVVVHHRILKVAKTRQGVCDEMGQRAAGLGLVGCKPERAERTETVAKPRFDKVQNLLDRVVRSELHRAGKGDIIGRRFAVFRVVVPFTTFWLISIHEKPRFSAHVAVEILHPQGLAAVGPAVELLLRADEPGVGLHCQV